MAVKQVRHGDLLIEKIDVLPEGLKDLKSKIVEEGEATGHFHRLDGNGTVLIDEATADTTKYLDITDMDCRIVHEEHNAIDLPKGVYKVTRQREFDAYEQAARTVFD